MVDKSKMFNKETELSIEEKLAYLERVLNFVNYRIKNEKLIDINDLKEDIVMFCFESVGGNWGVVSFLDYKDEFEFFDKVFLLYKYIEEKLSNFELELVSKTYWEDIKKIDLKHILARRKK